MKRHRAAVVSMQQTMSLALLMASIAVINASLMPWLWRFPLDANGASTAPRVPTNIHRALGYVFVLAYAALLFEMLPRAWEFRVASATGIVHGILGVLIGALLIVKIAVIRRFHQFGHRLPWIGGTLAVTTLVVSALGAIPSWRVTRPLAPLSPTLAAGRDVVSQKCNQCHGASVIAGEDEDAEKWDRTTREMQKYSWTIPGKIRIEERERVLATAYLAHILGEEEEEEEDSGRRRRRRRGRDEAR